MRITQLALALAGALMCTGCSELVSLREFVSDKEAVQDARLVGTWMDEDTLYLVKQDGKGYTISYSEKKSTSVSKLKAKLWKAGDARILDLTPDEEDPFQVAVHTPMRVWPEATTLKMAFLDSKWLREQASARLAVQTIGDRLLITSPGVEVTRFLLASGGDARAYEHTNVLTRRE